MSLIEVKSLIEAACRRAGRDSGEVKLVAVSKKQSLEKIKALFSEGQTVFGENYVQELLLKKKEIPAEWHLIGHLQKNKVSRVLGRCELIHSVDRFALAETLSRRAVIAGMTQKVLLQINLSNEESKEGFSMAALDLELASLSRLPGLSLEGLMTMPPLQNEPEANRSFFRQLRECAAACRIKSPQHPWTELSMGTSHDFEVAIEEGATLIRVGTRLFGARPSP